MDERAWESAEMGGYLLRRGQPGDIERSVEFFREALAFDPAYGRAYAGLGNAYLKLSRIDEGEAALHRSIELDPEVWISHLTLALLALYQSYDRPTARHHFEQALVNGSDQVVVRHTYAWFLAVAGDLEDAIDHMRSALELDPVSPRVNGDIGRLYYLGGRHDEAIAQCRRTLELIPESRRPRDCIIHALVEKGAYGEAAVEAMDALSAFHADVVERSGTALDRYWRRAAGEVTRRAERGEDSHVHAAAAWSRIHEVDREFEALESAWAVRCPVLAQIDMDPALAPLRGEPRYDSLLQRIRPSQASFDTPG